MDSSGSRNSPMSVVATYTTSIRIELNDHLETAMKQLTQLFLIATFFAAPAFAHDPILHKGPKVEGEIVAVHSDRLDIGTDQGTVAVTLATETTFESETGQKADRSNLKKGQHVQIAGHKLPTGGFIATMVMLGEAHEKSEPPHHHGDDE